MGKKDKMGVNKLFERVENLVSDALKRIDNLQNQVHELREQMMERVGLAEKEPKKSTKSSTSTASKTTSKPASSGKSTTQKKASGGSTAKKKDDLTQIKGVGPATAKKMQNKGITSINQIANPSADDEKKLEEFKKLKSFSSWQAEAKKLV